MRGIRSLLNLQALKISDTDMIGLLRDSKNRTRSTSLIQGTLYQSRSFAQVYFQRLLANCSPG